MVIDGGNAYADRRKAQNAADSAALAGALARIRGENWVEEVMDVAEKNGYDNDGKTNAVAVLSPPADGPYSCSQNDNCLEYFQVFITNPFVTWLAIIFFYYK